MNSVDYLRSLQKGVRLKSSAVDDIARYREKQFSSGELKRLIHRYSINTIEGQEKFVQDYVVKPFLEIISDANQSLKETYVGLLPTYDPNAQYIQVPAGGYLIAIHTGLFAAISFYNEFQYQAGKLLLNGNRDECRTLLNQSHGAIIDCFKEKKLGNYPMIKSTLTSDELMYTIMKTTANELFVIAHEFAHIHLGHKGILLYDTLPNYEEEKIIRIKRSQDQEYEADIQAILWLTSLYQKDVSNGLFSLASKSIALAVEVLMLFHILELNLKPILKYSTHPSAINRMKHIYDMCKSILNPLDQDFIFNMIKDASDTESFIVKPSKI